MKKNNKSTRIFTLLLTNKEEAEAKTKEGIVGLDPPLVYKKLEGPYLLF